jgi:hypothetical protein
MLTATLSREHGWDSTPTLRMLTKWFQTVAASERGSSPNRAGVSAHALPVRGCRASVREVCLSAGVTKSERLGELLCRLSFTGWLVCFGVWEALSGVTGSEDVMSGTGT